MNCPNCGIDSDFSLIETADDYQDGYVECNNCGVSVATFNTLAVIINEDFWKKLEEI